MPRLTGVHPLAIRRAFRLLAPIGQALAFDLLLESPEHHRERLAKGGASYAEINARGVPLLTQDSDLGPVGQNYDELRSTAGRQIAALQTDAA